LGTKFVTFDCYGTLVDWRSGIENNFRNLFNGGKALVGTDIFRKYVELEAKVENSYTSYKEILAHTSLRLANELGLKQDSNSAEKFAESITRWKAFQDSAPSLRELGRRGYKRVILSNIDSVLLSETIRNNKLEVDGFITAQDVKSYKPAKDHWLKFFQEYSADRDETLHIAGSIYHDVIPASELGLRTVWVNRYGERLPADASPTFIVDSLSSLLESGVV